MSGKPLLFIPSPRDIPQFNNALSKVRCDKLWLKYYPELEAYQKAREWFLDPKNDNIYSHFIICPDDLLITHQDVQALYKAGEYYNIISGWCRNTIKLTPWWTGEAETEDTADTNISITTLPPDPPEQGQYHQFNFASVKYMEHLRDTKVNSIIQIKFAGFPLTCISKKIIQLVPFRRGECCMDSCFSLDIDKKGIKQYCDVRVRTVHMNRHPNEIQTGKRKPEMIFEAA